MTTISWFTDVISHGSHWDTTTSNVNCSYTWHLTWAL